MGKRKITKVWASSAANTTSSPSTLKSKHQQLCEENMDLLPPQLKRLVKRYNDIDSVERDFEKIKNENASQKLVIEGLKQQLADETVRLSTLTGYDAGLVYISNMNLSKRIDNEVSQKAILKNLFYTKKDLLERLASLRNFEFHHVLGLGECLEKFVVFPGFRGIYFPDPLFVPPSDPTATEKIKPCKTRFDRAKDKKGNVWCWRRGTHKYAYVNAATNLVIFHQKDTQPFFLDTLKTIIGEKFNGLQELGRRFKMCTSCGAPLTDSKSLSLGMGSTCYKNTHKMFN